MGQQVGQQVVEVLEQAGTRFLVPLAPEALAVFIHHLGAGRFEHYDAQKGYWRRVQRLLDSFFTASERAAICEQLIDRLDLLRRPEAYGFFAEALAERRLGEMRAGLIVA